MNYLIAKLFFVLSVLLASTPSLAIDAFAKQKMSRPAQVDTSTVLSRGGLTIEYRPDIDSTEIPLNQIHNWLLKLTKRDGSPALNADIEAIAEMPEHLHGMTTHPVISATGQPGEYLVEGMNFHMPGWWVASFDVSGYGSRALLRFHLIVGEEDTHNSMDHSNHNDHSKIEMKDHESH